MATSKLVWRAEVVLSHFADDVEERMELAAQLVEGAAKRNLSQPGTGRTYKLYNPKRTHTASAPGQPPATDIGRLRSSITHKVVRKRLKVIGLVGANTEYARRQELGFVGTDALGRSYNQAERPYLRPALWNNKSEIKSILGVS